MIFIASLSHSGSTILDLLLSSAPKIVGLGEVYQSIDNKALAELKSKPESLCSCGKTVANCIFWSSVLSHLNSKQSFTKRYEILLAQFEQCFGKDYTILDSSKYVPALKIWTEELKVFPKVIWLSKDVRSWTFAQLKKKSKRSSFYVFHEWYVEQFKIESYLKKLKLPFFFLPYKNLCFDTQAQLSKLSKYLGQDIPLDYNLAASKAHIIRGNRVRLKPERYSTISYDRQWLESKDWKLASKLMPWVIKKNQKLGLDELSSEI